MTASDGDFLQRGWPYVALAVLACGLALRAWLIARPRPGGQARGRGGAVAVSARLAVARRAGRRWRPRTRLRWLFPRAVLAWNRVGWRLYVLEAITAAAGAIVVVLWLRALGRHLAGRDAGNGADRHQAQRMLSPSSLLLDLGDSVFLSLVALALVSGLLLAAAVSLGIVVGRGDADAVPGVDRARPSGDAAHRAPAAAGAAARGRDLRGAGGVSVHPARGGSGRGVAARGRGVHAAGGCRAPAWRGSWVRRGIGRVAMARGAGALGGAATGCTRTARGRWQVARWPARR